MNRLTKALGSLTRILGDSAILSVNTFRPPRYAKKIKRTIEQPFPNRDLTQRPDAALILRTVNRAPRYSGARYSWKREAPMPIVLSEWTTSQEISNRVDRLRLQYAGNPLVKRIDHHIGVDWSDDPAVFIEVILPGTQIAAAELARLAEGIRVDLLRLVRTDEIGLHSYLNFVN